MRSTGEVMGIDKTFAKAYAKAAIAAGQKLPTGGNVFITMIDKHKTDVVPIAKELQVGALASSLKLCSDCLDLLDVVSGLPCLAKTPPSASDEDCRGPRCMPRLLPPLTTRMRGHVVLWPRGGRHCTTQIDSDCSVRQ
jgi:hypothetical protein